MVSRKDDRATPRRPASKIIWSVACILVVFAAVGAAASVSDAEDLIYTLDSVGAVKRFLALCEKNAAAFEERSSRAGLPSSCSPLVASTCARHWQLLSYGVAGSFTKMDRMTISRCVGRTSILHIERDQPVEKDIDEDHFVGVGAFAAPKPTVTFANGTEDAIVTKQSEAKIDDSPFHSEMYLPYDIPIVVAFNERESEPGEQAVTRALWNLDRIDQKGLPLDGTYSFKNHGAGVNVYVLDSGVRRTHREFADRGRTRVTFGYDFVDDHVHAGDCDGHGTHIAGTVGGHAVGTAKEVNIHSVRVLDCEGQGMISSVVSALEWIAINHKPPAVATLSLGIPAGGWSEALERTVERLIRDFNILVVIASGNSMLDSCTIAPANVKSSLTVAGSDLIRKFDDAIHHRGTSDVLYKYSNTGKCVDIFAPGTDIYSACGGKNRCRRPGDDEYAWSSGTSMAVPHVAGVAATILSNFPNATASEVKQMILDASVPDQIDSSFKAGAPLPSTPNRMLYSKIPGLEESSVPRTRGFSFSGAQPIDPYYSPEERRQFLRMSFPDVVDVYLNGLSDGWQDWSWDVSTDDAMGVSFSITY